MDPVDRLVLSEWEAWGRPGDRVGVVDAPALAAAGLDAGLTVTAWCDDLRDEQALPDGVRVARSGAEFGAQDVYWLRLPKALSALDEYAGWCAGSGAALLAGGRIRHMNHSMNAVLARHFGDVSASLGRSGARVLRARQPRPGGIGWPRTTPQPGWGVTLSHHGATFSGGSVDSGTRLLLSRLDDLADGPDPAEIVDLGCGNGVIGVLLARRFPNATVRGIDVSLAAVRASEESARLNGVHLLVERRDGLAHLGDGSVDLVVTNPPFHIGTAKESTPTLDMLADAGRVLRPGGQVWCVFNSHLPWAAHLRDAVGPTRVVARSRTHTLTRSVKR